MVLLGLGFNIKMLQAYMFLPAIYLVYFFTAETKWHKRVIHLVAATAVLLAVSLSWCLAVDLTPAANRPFVGSSSTNSTLELAIGYNGLLRALPVPKGTMAEISGAISQVPNEGAAAGVFRFFNKEMAGQASWMLPMAIFGLIALFMKAFQKETLEREKSKSQSSRLWLRQLLLWGGIFVPMTVYFSISGHIHRYYLIMFVPCLAVLAAVAITKFEWKFKIYKDGKVGWQNLLLPLAFAFTAAVQVFILRTYAARYSKVLVPLIIACVGLAVLLMSIIIIQKKGSKVVTGIALAAGITGLLAAPAYWAYTPIQYGTNVITPYAGPPAISKPYADPKTDISQYSWGEKWYAGQDLTGELISVDMVKYLQDNDSGARWQLAVPSIMYATPLILSDDVTVMPLGGFIGTDKSITLENFKKLVEKGELQYFLVMPMEKSEISSWVMSNGRWVDPAEYSKMPKMEFYMLYDLSGLRSMK
jgi:4-amino-4-deoxy-L-arabinose transferase-like glycosyltransferase